jgi:hypothetical protein
MARRDFNSKLRQVYFYLPAISGGAIAALVSASILLFHVFVWIFGGAGTVGSRYFQFLGWAVPTILVGLGIWGYHQRLAQEEAGRVQEKRQSAQRVYFYLMAFLGLATAVIGLSILFGLLVETGTQMTATAGWWRHQLSVALAMLARGHADLAVLLERYFKTGKGRGDRRVAGIIAPHFPVCDYRRRNCAAGCRPGDHYL